MIKVYVHKTKDWIVALEPHGKDLWLVDGALILPEAFQGFNEDEWTEIGEL